MHAAIAALQGEKNELRVLSLQLGVTQAAEQSKHEQYKRMLLPHEEGSF